MFVTPKRVDNPDPNKVYVCESVQQWTMEVKSERDHGMSYEVSFKKLTFFAKEERGVDFDFACTCPHWSRRVAKHSGEYCKHIMKVKRLHCGWRQDVDGRELVDGRCPKCGAQVVELDEMMKPFDVEEDDVDSLVEW